MKKYNLCFIFILTIFIFCSCNTQAELSEEDEYVKMIEDMDETISSLYIVLDDMEELIKETKANLVIRCKVKNREESVVYDPFGVYNTTLFVDKSVNEQTKIAASSMIYTPYTLDVLEVYLGNTYTEKNTITYYAPYGVIGEYKNKISGYPVFRVGDEYILFLRADNVNGKWMYYLSHPMYSTYTISTSAKSSGVENQADAIYNDYVNAEEVIKKIKELIAENTYDTSAEYID